jgi:hypothetical protein
MIKLSLLETALLLGAYVALAGCYGLVYALARLQDVTILRHTSVIVYVLHGITALAILIWTPLEVVWKGLIVASSIAFFAIPPITWRYLQRTHETEVQQ